MYKIVMEIVAQKFSRAIASAIIHRSFLEFDESDVEFIKFAKS